MVKWTIWSCCYYWSSTSTTTTTTNDNDNDEEDGPYYISCCDDGGNYPIGKQGSRVAVSSGGAPSSPCPQKISSGKNSGGSSK